MILLVNFSQFKGLFKVFGENGWFRHGSVYLSSDHMVSLVRYWLLHCDLKIDLNPKNAEIFLTKLSESKGVFNLKPS